MVDTVAVVGAGFNAARSDPRLAQVAQHLPPLCSRSRAELLDFCLGAELETAV
jgi:hypothetical protein